MGFLRNEPTLRREGRGHLWTMPSREEEGEANPGWKMEQKAKSTEKDESGKLQTTSYNFRTG